MQEYFCRLKNLFIVLPSQLTWGQELLPPMPVPVQSHANDSWTMSVNAIQCANWMEVEFATGFHMQSDSEWVSQSPRCLFVSLFLSLSVSCSRNMEIQLTKNSWRKGMLWKKKPHNDFSTFLLSFFSSHIPSYAHWKRLPVVYLPVNTQMRQYIWFIRLLFPLFCFSSTLKWIVVIPFDYWNWSNYDIQ